MKKTNLPVMNFSFVRIIATAQHLNRRTQQHPPRTDAGSFNQLESAMISTIPEVSRRKYAARAAGLLLCAMASSPAFSGGAGNAFHVVAIEDQASGELITSGQFSEAAEEISETRFSRRSFAAHNNLCVAYIKLKRIDDATESCNAAITARSPAVGASHWRPGSGSGSRWLDKALALSNRGVLRALSGDLDGAKNDFERSARLSDKLEEARINIARLSDRIRTGTTTAQNTL